jgi:hypothetical protein
VAALAFAVAQRPVVSLDLSAAAPAELDGLVAGAQREAVLTGAGLVVGWVDDLAERAPDAVRRLAAGRHGLVLLGARRWDPAWSPTAPLVLDVPVLTAEARAVLWRQAFNGDAPGAFDPGAATAAFRLGPDHIVRAATTARQHAAHDDRPVVVADLHAGARSQNAAGLERLARRVVPWAGWTDLVLAPSTEGLLQELTARVRHR